MASRHLRCYGIQRNFIRFLLFLISNVCFSYSDTENKFNVTGRSLVLNDCTSSISFIIEREKNSSKEIKNGTSTIIGAFIEIVAPRSLIDESNTARGNKKNEEPEQTVINPTLSKNNTSDSTPNKRAKKYSDKNNAYLLPTANSTARIKEAEDLDGVDLERNEIYKEFRKPFLNEKTTEVKKNDIYHHVKRRERANGRRPKIWDQWGNWTNCSVTCGIGKLTRWRHCIAGACSLGEKRAQLKTCTFPSC